MSRSDYEALRERLDAVGVDTSAVLTNSYGAVGHAPEAFYFNDPDENVLEARFYQEA